MREITPSAIRHIEHTQQFFDSCAGKISPLGSWYRKKLATYMGYYLSPEDRVLEIGCGEGLLLEQLPCRQVTGIDISEKQLALARQRVPHGRFLLSSGEMLDLDETFDVIVISDTLNHAGDVQAILERARKHSTSRTRLLLSLYNPFWRPFFVAAQSLGLMARGVGSNWLDAEDVHSLLRLSGWELVSRQSRILFPFPAFAVERGINRWLAPFLTPLNLCDLFVARDSSRRNAERPSVSIVVPARNESGNIDALVRRVPQMGSFTELIFVEGNSTDDTWAKIKDLPIRYPEKTIRIMKQTGVGKGNAVREGYAVATGDILMILDADMTVLPEELPRFYDALNENVAEFANGVRLVYPMEKNAMQFLNFIGNKFFAYAFSWVLGQSVKDTLCGTKAMWRKEYVRLEKNRSYFGDFDPFGDFDLLFGSNKLGLRVQDIPVRYVDRQYGKTNIHRWRHGAILIRMLWFASRRIKFI